MIRDLDTISGLAVHTGAGRTFYPDTRVLGIRGDSLWLTQDVTGATDFDYQDVALEGSLLALEEALARPLTPYRLIKLPLAGILRLDVETVAETDEDSLTELALEYVTVS